MKPLPRQGNVLWHRLWLLRFVTTKTAWRLCRDEKANEPDTAQLAYDLAIRGNRIVYPALFALTAACPHCHNAVVHDTDAVGAKIQRPAIHVHEIFAECRACHHMWWGTEIPLLAGSI